MLNVASKWHRKTEPWIAAEGGKASFSGAIGFRLTSSSVLGLLPAEGGAFFPWRNT